MNVENFVDCLHCIAWKVGEEKKKMQKEKKESEKKRTLKFLHVFHYIYILQDVHHQHLQVIMC